MKALLSALLGLFALAPPALAQAPLQDGHRLTDVTPHPTQLLAVRRANLTEIGGVTFRVPPKPDPSWTRFEWTVAYEYIPFVGGQNRSLHPHPGFVNASGEYVALAHWFLAPDGSHALPGMITSRTIGAEWGPTEPANGAHLTPDKWPEAFEAGNDSIYWGPRPFDADNPRRHTVRHFLDQDYTWMSFEEGMLVTFVPEWWWYVPSWEGSHAYPWYVDWRANVSAWGRWLPPEPE